jgi:non-heme chloroperoxidase
MPAPPHPRRRLLTVAAAALIAVPAVGADRRAQAPEAWRDPSPHQVRRVTVDTAVGLEVLDWGGTGPPLVLLGCYLSAHVYDEFAPKLTSHFHVYGITRRGIGASDKPAGGYQVQRSADDVLEVLAGLKLDSVVLLGTSCAGQVQTLFAGQHPDRVQGLVYLDGASDPTTTAAEYDPPMPDLAALPRQLTPPAALDTRSFAAYRASQQRTQHFAFPEAELRQLFGANPDGSLGESQLSPAIRRAITIDARMRPDYTRIRAPVLAIYQAQRSFDEVAGQYVIENDRDRTAVRQLYKATAALYALWKRQLRAAVPTARIVDLPGANVYMFLTHEADVLRDVRAFAASLPGR